MVERQRQRLRLADVARGRDNNFDALRLILASLVIFSHSYPLARGSNRNEPLARFTDGQKTAGEVAVESFFILSGFLVTASWFRGSGCIDFLRKRALRVYPGFLVAVLLSGFLAGSLLAVEPWSYLKQVDVRRFIVRALNFEVPFDLEINGSLWSVRYEVCCYLAVVAIGMLGLLRRRLVVLAAAGCTALYAAQLHLGLILPGSRLTWLWCAPEHWPRVAACFWAGSAFFLYRDRVVHSSRLALAALAALLLLARFPQAKGLDLFFPILGGYLLLYFAYAPIRPLELITRRGDFSYGLYLYAFPIQRLLVQALGSDLSPLGLFVAAWMATLVTAALSWYLVERPALSLKQPSRPQAVLENTSPGHFRTGEVGL
jgi:peptidoglycan/LPS O-acetylase OafA/YrhL